MTTQLRTALVAFWIRRSVRYLLVSNGFRIVQAVVVLAALSFVLTGSRIAFIDRFGNRADIVAAILVTMITTVLLASLNRRVMNAIDRRFFREAYNAKQILTELGEAIPTLSKTTEVLELVASKINAALHPKNVTIFLDDEDSRTYVAAFSADGSNPIAERWRLRNLVLRYDGVLINHLETSMQLTSVELKGSAFLISRPGAQESEFMLSDSENRTLREVHAALLIPITFHGHLHGLISLGQRLSGLPYEREDKLLLLVVVNQIASFTENMKLVSRLAKEERVARELEMAAEVQRHLFPADGFENDAVEIYGLCLPARGVGGDYYDYFAMDERRTGIAIADVAGKGIAAALLMSTVQASLRCQLSSEDISLAAVVSSMNRLLRRSTDDGGYATFFFAEFDKATRSLTYVNAGHNPPILVRSGSQEAFVGAPLTPLSLSQRTMRAGGGIALSIAAQPVVELLTTGGPIIGTFLDGPYEQDTIQLFSGDILAVYTDGVTEATNVGDVEFGERRLRALLVDSVHLTARQVVERVFASVLEWQAQAPQHDDITLIIAKVR